MTPLKPPGSCAGLEVWGKSCQVAAARAPLPAMRWRARGGPRGQGVRRRSARRRPMRAWQFRIIILGFRALQYKFISNNNNQYLMGSIMMSSASPSALIDSLAVYNS